mmetsp:Transcript_57502/g.95536  ORF Transcript_57502/g.95536 Transcript_57502/m.95536 type:complete len:161 (+) Transcript_57502:32-514(+)
MDVDSSLQLQEPLIGDPDELNENVKNTIDKMKQKFSEIESMISDLIAHQNQTALDVTSSMDAVEKAKYFACLAYCIQTLYNVHLRLQNDETRIESSDLELNRVKESILKIKTIVNVKQNQNNKNEKTNDEQVNANGNQRSIKVDTAAAKRFITHHLESQH